MKKKKYIFLLKEATVKELDDLAEKEGINRTALVQIIINNFLKMKGENNNEKII